MDEDLKKTIDILTSKSVDDLEKYVKDLISIPSLYSPLFKDARGALLKSKSKEIKYGTNGDFNLFKLTADTENWDYYEIEINVIGVFFRYKKCDSKPDCIPILYWLPFTKTIMFL